MTRRWLSVACGGWAAGERRHKRTNAMTELRWTPIGYWMEWRPGDVCLYTPEHFAREGFAPSAEIRGLYTAPQPGCPQEPAAYRGRFWHRAKHYPNNSSIDPDAVPLYLGQVLNDPARDTWPMP